MNADVFEKYESEVRSYCRSFPSKFLIAKDCYIYSEDGKEYLDFFSGAGALNYGHNNPYIKEKLLEYILNDGITHALDMYTGAKEEFIETFQEKILKPRGLDYKMQFTGPTGTNAVEAALKRARNATGRQNVFALMGAFHGMTLGSLALTTAAGSRAGAGVTLNNVYHVPAPYMFPDMDVLEFIEKILSDKHSGVEKPAAFILETVQIESGVHVLDVEFLQEIRKICDKYGILLIVDDIQAGCGRTGAFFSFEDAGIIPDMVTLSKSISGYGLPMAITLIKPEYDAWWDPGEHNGTFRGNQHAFVTAKAGIEFALKESIYEKAGYAGDIAFGYLKEKLHAFNDIEIRGTGLIIGIDVKDETFAKDIVTKCFEKGLIIERTSNHSTTLKILPPLTIKYDDLMKGLNIIIDSIKEVKNNK